MLQNHWNVPSGEHILSFTPSSRPHVSSFRYAAFSFRFNTNFNSFRQLTSLQKQAFFYGTIATAAGFFPKCLPSWNTVPNCLPLSIWPQTKSGSLLHPKLLTRRACVLLIGQSNQCLHVPPPILCPLPLRSCCPPFARPWPTRSVISSWLNPGLWTCLFKIGSNSTLRGWRAILMRIRKSSRFGIQRLPGTSLSSIWAGPKIWKNLKLQLVISLVEWRNG